MTYTVILSESFEKRAERFLRQHPTLRGRYEKTLRFLKSNPWHPSLRLHKLSGQMDGLYAVSITFSYRMTLLFRIEEHQITPIDIGSHDQVY